MLKSTMAQITTTDMPRFAAVKDRAFRFFKRWMRRQYARKALGEAEKFFLRPPFDRILAACPELPEKVLRPYFARKLTTERRTEALTGHYRLFLDYFSDDVLVQMHLKQITLLEHEGEFGKVTVIVGNQQSFYREAELTISIFFNDQPMVAMGIALTTPEIFGLHKPGRALWIGILKATVPGTESLDRARAFTKAFEGLRPKAFCLMVAQAMARALGIETIYAPSNEGYVFAAYFGLRTRVKADYDSFWLDSGGSMVTPGIFQLPALKQQRDLKDYKANKRAQVRRRQALEAGFADQFEAGWRALMRTPTAGDSR